MEELLSRPEAFIQTGTSLKSMFMLLALSAARLYALVQIFPPMGDQGLQGAVRNGIVLLMALFIAWGQPAAVVADIDTFQLAGLVIKECMLGLVLGFAASIVFWVAEAAGALIDNQAGYNSVQQSNPMSGSESTPIGNVMAQLAQSVFWMLGGFTVLMAVVFQSYAWWPMGKMLPDGFAMLPGFLEQYVTYLMRMTVTLAAPVLMVLVLIDVGFGLIAKTAEKLEPNNLAQPIKGAVALLMVSLLVAVFFHEAKPQLILLDLKQELSTWMQGAKPR